MVRPFFSWLTAAGQNKGQNKMWSSAKWLLRLTVRLFTAADNILTVAAFECSSSGENHAVTSLGFNRPGSKLLSHSQQ